MSHTISIHNKSDHKQEFEVHGFNGNANITVPAHGTSKIAAPDGASGAIIALHDGHEGEEAEITKKGFGGNDFIDISNIVGAGGNVTVMQVAEPSTMKGDATFMQGLNEEWKKADQKTRDSVKPSLHFDKAGNVVRMDGTTNKPALIAFVRRFAEGKTYIDTGAWNGKTGDDGDNQQSKAGKGNRDIIVTYSDGDATPDGVKPANGHLPEDAHKYTVKAGDTFFSIAKDHGIAVEEIEKANPGVDAKKLQIGQVINLRPSSVVASTEHVGVSLHPVERVKALSAQLAPAGNEDNGKAPGILLSNKSKQEETYFFFDNYWNGNGTAGANFDHPLKSVKVAAGHTTFVSLATSFKGRVQRGKLIPATWAEFQIEASNDHKAHGDISVEQGNDGPATISSTDGTNVSGGFTTPINAPPAAFVTRSDGKRVIASTMGNWMGGPNEAAIKAQESIKHKAYVQGGTGVPDIASANKRLAVHFY
ncbi:hypothetical protein AAFC00_002793 [Neodothiora populina]|uniref:LysM domain-containing protein n=1 Tax=Neodothiora populina TaxID=2781224 RepID=A0ABR3P8J2_9PEZI